LKALPEASAQAQSLRRFQHDLVVTAVLELHRMNPVELHNCRAVNADKTFLAEIALQLQQRSAHHMRVTSNVQASVTTHCLDPVDVRNILTAAHGIGSPGGHFDNYPFPPDRVRPWGPIEAICSGAEECREAVRYQLKWGADVIKIAASGGVLSESDPVGVPQLTPEEVTAIISEAHKWGRKVAVHCHGDAAARVLIQAGVDSIEHGSFLAEDTLKLMKVKGVYLVPTEMALYWSTKEAEAGHYPPQIAAKALVAAAAAHEAMFKSALRIGVRIAFGTDAGVYPHGINAMEFGLMTDLGMSPAAAPLAGTRESAKLLGVDKDVGTLEAGKVADIVAVPGNVLNDIHATENPVFVMHLGHIELKRQEDKASRRSSDLECLPPLACCVAAKLRIPSSEQGTATPDTAAGFPRPEFRQGPHITTGLS
jgi:hypothetical protein